MKPLHWPVHVDYFDHVSQKTSWPLVAFKDEGMLVEETSDVDLLEALKTLAVEVSYFNAAEGSDYTREAGSRRAAQAKFNTLVEIAKERGIYNPEDFKNYLV
jgi:hypothetical protein